LWREHEIIAPGFISKPLEFDRFEIRVAQFFPQTEKLNRAATAHPVVDNGERFERVAVFRNIRERDVILIVLFQNCDGRSLYGNRSAFSVLHDSSLFLS
jgi:hypothetical protein